MCSFFLICWLSPLGGPLKIIDDEKQIFATAPDIKGHQIKYFLNTNMRKRGEWQTLIICMYIVHFLHGCLISICDLSACVLYLHGWSTICIDALSAGVLFLYNYFICMVQCFNRMLCLTKWSSSQDVSLAYGAREIPSEKWTHSDSLSCIWKLFKFV